MAFDNPGGGVTVFNTEIFQASPYYKRIRVLNLEGKPVREFPTVVQEDQKMTPEDVALDGRGNLWVVGWTDSAEFAVKYTREGKVLTKIKLPASAPDTSRGIAVDTASNYILVTQSRDSLARRPNYTSFIAVYKEDGTLVRAVEREESRPNQQYLAVTPNGNILVSNKEKNCISVYNKGGRLLREVGVKVVKPRRLRGRVTGKVIFSGLNDPRGICIDSAGSIIVADYGNSRVVLFDNNGKFRKTLVSNIAPQAVATTTEGNQVRLVVTHPLDNKVSIHSYTYRYKHVYRTTANTTGLHHQNNETFKCVIF